MKITTTKFKKVAPRIKHRLKRLTFGPYYTMWMMANKYNPTVFICRNDAIKDFYNPTIAWACLYKTNKTKNNYEFHVYVDKKFRGFGLATKLFLKSIAHIKRYNSCATIYIYKHNKLSKQFYNKMIKIAHHKYSDNGFCFTIREKHYDIENELTNS